MTDTGAITLKPIGKVRTSYERLADCPPTGHANPDDSVLELDDWFADGLLNAELSTHLIVLYWFDRADRTALHRKTRPGEVRRGVFASRTPHRPNPIALSVVRLLAHEGNRLRVSGLDCLDGTAILDIKIYDPHTDCIPEARLDFESYCHQSTCGCHAVPTAQNAEN